MIRHIVLVRFRENISPEAKKSLFTELRALKTKIPGILDFQSGANVSVETELVRKLNDLFWFDFVDLQTRDAYLSHPAHAAIGKRLVEHLDGGVDGIVVADIELA